MLDGVKEKENRNLVSIINKIKNIAAVELERLEKKPTKAIINASFEASLEGIEKGFMDYKKDIVVETILEKVSLEIKKFENLSEEEMKNLIVLTKNQIKELRQADAIERDTFLEAEPNKLDP